MLLLVLVVDPHQVPSHRTMSFFILDGGLIEGLPEELIGESPEGLTWTSSVALEDIIADLVSEGDMLDWKRCCGISAALFILLEMSDTPRLSV